MVLGTHSFDLMRHLAGDAQVVLRPHPEGWPQGRSRATCGRAASRSARSSATTINATYGFAGLATGHFMTHVAKAGAGTRYWLEVRGTKGTIQSASASCRPRSCARIRRGFFGKSKAPWQPITSAGVGKPEPLDAKAIDNGNILIANDLIDAIEKDRPPLDSIHDGRAALEMILAVYESHRQERPVELPLKNRKHPLAGW